MITAFIKLPIFLFLINFACLIHVECAFLRTGLCFHVFVQDPTKGDFCYTPTAIPSVCKVLSNSLSRRDRCATRHWHCREIHSLLYTNRLISLPSKRGRSLLKNTPHKAVYWCSETAQVSSQILKSRFKHEMEKALVLWGLIRHSQHLRCRFSSPDSFLWL